MFANRCAKSGSRVFWGIVGINTLVWVNKLGSLSSYWVSS